MNQEVTLDEVTAARSTSAPASPVRFGTILFLASELLLFGGLFAAYFGLRSRTTPWPPNGVVPDTALAALGTALLMLSSFCLARGLGHAATGNLVALRRWTVVTIALGVGFLATEAWDWTHVDFAISSNPYGTIYYTLTGIHGLHVIAGLLVLSALIARSFQGAYDTGALDGAHSMAYYWQFCDATWILIFLVVFVLR
ncbi:MAG: cytochrome c oxidase subunit 3 [Actinomycetota bacterium]